MLFIQPVMISFLKGYCTLLPGSWYLSWNFSCLTEEWMKHSTVFILWSYSCSFLSQLAVVWASLFSHGRQTQVHLQNPRLLNYGFWMVHEKPVFNSWEWTGVLPAFCPHQLSYLPTPFDFLPISYGNVYGLICVFYQTGEGAICTWLKERWRLRITILFSAFLTATEVSLLIYMMQLRVFFLDAECCLTIHCAAPIGVPVVI